MKRFITSVLLLAFVMAMLTACVTSPPAPPAPPAPAPSAPAAPSSSAPAPAGKTFSKAEIKLTTNGTDIATCTTSANFYSKNISEITEGKVNVRVFPNDQLAGGNQSKGIEMLAQGSTDMGFYSNGVLGNLDQKIQIANTPFIFDSYADATASFRGVGGQYLAGLLDAKGVMLLGAFHNGLRQLSNSKRRVLAPADVKGLKIRVPGGEAYVETFRALGADAVAMSWSEVFTALQQGTLDGQENGFATQYSNKIYEVQKYVTILNYMYDSFNMVANKANFLKLDDATQTLLKEQAAVTSDFGNTLVEDGEAEIKAFYIDYGLEVTELTPDQLGAFKDVVKPVQEMLFAKYGQEACDAFFGR